MKTCAPTRNSLFVRLAAPDKWTSCRSVCSLGGWKGDSFDKAVAKVAGDSPELLDNLAIADRLAPMMDGASKIQGNSGTREDARTALRRWATRSAGGGSAGARRVARATRTGGAALAGLARAGAGQAPERDAPHIRALAGRHGSDCVHPSLLFANVMIRP
jgi:hypothetical protein